MSISVHYNISPRIILVDSTTTNISVQILLNQIRDVEDELSNLGYPKLIAAGGKEDLGSGVQVGITATLQNAQIMFAARTVPLEDGTCTTANIGIVLETSSGDFINSGVYKGCTVLNNTTNSMAAIYEVVSATRLNTFQISGGSRTTWQVGDEYKIYPNVQCSIDGGNLVAVDSNDNPIDVVLQSPNVQVIRSSSSSATNQELSAIQYSSFGGGVTIDIVNGVAGTTYNIGTLENPVNNVPDALIIANERGFEKFHVHGDLTLTTGHVVDGFEFEGHSPSKNTITIEDAASTIGCTFGKCTISGVLDGNSLIECCNIGDLYYVYGRICSSALFGTTTLAGGDNVYMTDCSILDPDKIPIIDMGGSGQDIILSDWSGGIKFRNMTGNNKIGIQIDGGKVWLENTITAGYVGLTGIGELFNDSTGTVIVDHKGLLSNETIGSTSYAGDVVIDTVNGVAGTSFPTGTRKVPSNNLTDALIICDNNNIKRLRLRSDLIIEAGHDISEMSIETRGIMGTEVTLEVGCDANNTVFRYVNLQGTVNNSDVLLVENCSIFNLSNFTGIMQGVSFVQGSEISIGTWAEIYNCRAGGEAGNEPEISIGNGLLSIQQYRGNLKLTDKTGSDRTVASFLPGNVTIADTCVAGKIQILGLGDIEKDESGPGCQVDFDAALTNEYIADHVLDEKITEHSGTNSLGLSIQKTLGLLHSNIYMSSPVYDSDDNLISCLVRIYSISGSVGTDNDVIGSYQVIATTPGESGKFTTWKQIEI